MSKDVDVLIISGGVIGVCVAHYLAELVMDRLWLGEPEPAAGHLTLTEGAGFGVEVNQAML
jgi:glycine/D-amino acid oxidase-like deaminating enzyme